jgi:hypothetical protein
MPIARIELSRFRFEIERLAVPSHGATRGGNLDDAKDDRLSAQRWTTRVETGDVAGANISPHPVGTLSSFGQALMLAPRALSAATRTRAKSFGRTCRAVAASGDWRCLSWAIS